MKHREYERQRGCVRKRPYPDQASAMRGWDKGVYFCRFCAKWHRRGPLLINPVLPENFKLDLRPRSVKS